MGRRPSTATRLVFQAFLDSPGDESYGFELSKATGLPSGTIYPILRRLEDDDLIKSRWSEVQTDTQRRQRRYYKLTAEGRRAAQAATVEQRQALRLLAPGLASGA
jgi:PadR family transcriptional regulator, regulatory protein PadR